MQDVFGSDFNELGGFNWTDQFRNRMNQRANRIFTPELDLIKDKTVLDIGARHGVWSWAALSLGAASALSVEGRANSIKRGEKMFSTIDPARYTAMHGDIYGVLPELLAQGKTFQTILCLGIYYHVYDHYGLMTLMDQFEPEYIVIDTEGPDTMDPMVRIRLEVTDDWNNAIAQNERQKKAAVGDISRGGVAMLGESFGYKIHWCNWDDLDKPDGLERYYDRRRYTCVLHK